MVWSAPRTWTAGEVVTAAQANTELRDNLRFLKGLDGEIGLDNGVNVGTYYVLFGNAAGSSTVAGRAQRNSTLFQFGDGTNVRTVVAPTATGTIGDVLFHDGTNWTRLTGMVRGDVLYAGANGTLNRLSAATGSGSFLVSSGTAADPSWTAPAAGAITNAGSATATATATLDIALSTSQRFLEIFVYSSGTNKVDHSLLMSFNPGSAGSYGYRVAQGADTGSFEAAGSFALNLTGTPGDVLQFHILVFNQSGTGKMVSWAGGMKDATAAAGGVERSIQGVGWWNGSSTVGTIRFVASGTNWGLVNAVVNSRD